MIKISVTIVFVFVIAIAQIVAQKRNPQTVFDLEGEMQSEVVVPATVVAVLKSDQFVNGCFKSKDSVKETEFFAASEIDLNGDNRKDLIIKAKDACLYGSNQGPFWIFQNARNGYREILSASGLQLAVLPRKSNSFNQIKIGKVVAMKPSNEIYRFRAGKYRAGK